MFSDDSLQIDCRQGRDGNSIIYSLSGPVTLRNMFEFQRRLRSAATPPLTVFDLTHVPYMDSAGIGLVVNHHVHCQNKGGRLVAAGVTGRVFELIKMIRVDSILHLTATIDEAESQS
ncbi:MAG TPA: STAS domain-containing protein [Terracidiphilus sp.]|nr:STAS domain-containing protein [Terracidiphilus sp.]